jgi:hypothetical protein
MKRQIAMVVAGMFSTLAVVGGTIAAAQSGAFTNPSTTIEPNGEITVPEITPTLEEQAYTVVETRTIVVTAQPIPSSTVEPTAIVKEDDGPSQRETVLLSRLNQAYSTLKQRDTEYQTKLKEAYDKLKTASVVDNGASSSQGSAPASAPSAPAQPQPVAAAPTSVSHSSDHEETSEHKEDSQSSETHDESSQTTQQSHESEHESGDN